VSWAAVALADKLDTFVSLSRAGERATGSRDPFGLRRQTQGAVRILMDLPELTGIDREVWLGPILTRAATHAPDTTKPWTGEAAQAALTFAIERVRFALESRGFGGEVVRAATPAGDVSPLRARRVAEALQGMRASEDFQALAILFKRVKNIAPPTLRPADDPQAQGRPEHGRGTTGAGQQPGGSEPVDRDALVEPAEQALLEALDLRRPRIQAAVARSDYRAAFVDIAGLRAAVDRFFTEVFVMAEDPRVRQARLKLMADLRDLILHLADISEIIPQTE
jgi:glycyl-tRNA synthetase beta chain